MHEQARTWRVEAAPLEAATRSQQLARPPLKDGASQVDRLLKVAAQKAADGVCALPVEGLKNLIGDRRGGKARPSCCQVGIDLQMDVEAAGLRMRMSALIAPCPSCLQAARRSASEIMV